MRFNVFCVRKFLETLDIIIRELIFSLSFLIL